MIAKIENNSYIDIDTVSFVKGDYTAEDNIKNSWKTEVISNSCYIVLYGQEGKNVSDAFHQKHRSCIYDYVPGSETYRKAI